MAKHSKIIGIILVFLLFIMTVFSQTGNDISNNRDFYEDNIVTADILERSSVWVAIVLFFSSIGVTFTQFRILQFLIWFTSIYFFVKRFSVYPVVVLACCFLFPLCSFGAQFRNGIMVGLIYLSLYCLFTLEKRKAFISFLSIVVAASFIHTMALLYLPLLLVYLPYNTRKLTIVSIVFCLVMTVIVNTSILLGMVSSNFGDWNAQYLSSAVGLNLTIFILLVGIVANTRLSYMYSSIVLKHKEAYDADQVKIAKFIPRVNILLVSLIPLLFLSLSFYRVYQNMFILTAILALNAYRVKRKSRDIDLFIYLGLYALITIFYNRWQGEFFIYLNGIQF